MNLRFIGYYIINRLLNESRIKDISNDKDHKNFKKPRIRKKMIKERQKNTLKLIVLVCFWPVYWFYGTLLSYPQFK